MQSERMPCQKFKTSHGKWSVKMYCHKQWLVWIWFILSEYLDAWQHTWFDRIVLEMSISISKIKAWGWITNHNFLHVTGDSSELLHLTLQLLHAGLMSQALHYVAPVFGLAAKPQHPAPLPQKCKNISETTCTVFYCSTTQLLQFKRF